MLFSEIIGQEKAKRFFKRVISEERLPHAYLFTGIPGIGKTRAARALTMALNCRAPADLDGCGSCPSCRQMLGGNFPDFIYIKPDGQNIKIEQIRDLNRRLSFAPVSAKHRVCVLQQAEAMTVEAANSFLKTLEEPPPGNILILNAVEPLDLLPTIVSRCQRVPFQPLPVQAMTDWLIKEKDIDSQTAIIVAKASGGSLGRALKMSEDVFLEKRREWVSGLLKLPRLSKGEALQMAVESTAKDKRGGPDGSKSGEPGLLEMLAVWGYWYRDLLLMKAAGQTRLIMNVDFSDKLQILAKSSKIENLIDSLFAVDKAIKDLRRMRNSTLVMEHVLLTLQRLAGYYS
ncbi:MAG: DNA polymerase III subunit delta' [Proteobacteria bacterium]|nr:DNA polymerase III subunit delta' [Pseudomonadota bacterium]MBU0990709.1 DNA polymerase III subunit delta' [Pseudomonadota bacterium]MBU1904137.1 DNA polymerase III subunit delta' [Pseudomonadota bacterium]